MSENPYKNIAYKFILTSPTQHRMSSSYLNGLQDGKQVAVKVLFFFVWFGLVVWHCSLLNANPFLYIYIKYMISKHILLITF